MSEKKKVLTKVDGSKRFHESIQRLYPNIPKNKLRPLSNEVLLRLSENMDKGFVPAVAKLKPDGTMDIIVMHLEEFHDELKKKK